MKKTKQSRKLYLNLETVKILRSGDLQRVIGGLDITDQSATQSACTVGEFRADNASREEP